jgi:hypothetical protein
VVSYTLFVYKESDIASHFGVREVKRVQKRHIGGKAGQKGTRFEDFFAAYKLAEHLAHSYASGSGRFRDRTRTEIHSQVFAFVDDVVVEHKKTRIVEHYQLKNAKSVSWKSGSPSISDAFKKQRDLCAYKGLKGHLYLVVPTNALRRNLDKKRISYKVSCDGVLQFPFNKFDVLVQSYRPFREALITVTPFSLPHIETDKLVTLARLILAIWISAPNRLTVKKLAIHLRSTQCAFVRPMTPFLPMPVGVERILGRIPGFRFKLQKGFLFWSCGSVNNGVYPHNATTRQFRNLMNRIKKSRPRTFGDIEEQLR